MKPTVVRSSNIAFNVSWMSKLSLWVLYLFHSEVHTIVCTPSPFWDKLKSFLANIRLTIQFGHCLSIGLFHESLHFSKQLSPFPNHLVTCGTWWLYFFWMGGKCFDTLEISFSSCPGTIVICMWCWTTIGCAVYLLNGDIAHLLINQNAKCLYFIRLNDTLFILNIHIFWITEHL